MSDDLLKKLREENGLADSVLSSNERKEAADRIEELEAAVEWQCGRAEKAEAENARLREALMWYRGNVSWCNNFGPEGTEARDRLAKDVGQRADAALQEGGG